MKKLYVTVLFCLSTVLAAFQTTAQLLPANQPEQDACNALLLCGNSFYTPYSYQGTGVVADMPATPCGGGEGNSVWLRLEVATAGDIVFSIIPIDTTDDYDFAVVDATGVNCDAITSADVIRCNFNNNMQPNPYYFGGIIGANYTSTVPTVYSGTYGSPFVQAISAAAGDVFLIMINNFGGSGGPSSGFTIDFAGSTATFVGDGTPAYDSLAAVPCDNVQTLTVFMDNSILCQSIAADGSDFRLEPAAATVTSAVGVNCSGANGYTQEIQLTFSSPLGPGHYRLRPQTGTDGNTLLDLCLEEQLLSDSISFDVARPVIELGPDTITCVGDSVVLHASLPGGLAGNQFAWTPAATLSNPGSLDPVAWPVEDMYYTLTVTPNARPECFSKDSVHITVFQGFDLLTDDTVVCVGTPIPMIVTGDLRYDFAWTPGSGLSDSTIHNPIATPTHTTNYTVTASFPGCTDSSRSVLITVDTAVPSFVYFTADKREICTGETINFTPQIDAGAATLYWSFGDGTSADLPMGGVQHAYDQEGIMPVNMSVDFLACPDTSFSDTIVVHPYPVVHLGSDSSICLDGNPVFLQNLFANPPGHYRYLWNTGDTTEEIKVVHPGQFSLTITSDNDCAATESVVIRNDCYIDIPNAFTPDGNGQNDYFFPRQYLSEKLTGFSMRIFNRWGQLVFETDRTDGRGWDGNFNGEPQPQGVYVYLIQATIDGRREERYQGNVTLIR